MIETIQRAIASMNKKKENGEGGFSLIELIVVVAILGILVAIAIPVFGNIQTTAKHNALATKAANEATAVAAAIANGDTVNEAWFTAASTDGYIVSSHMPTEGDTVNTATDNVCVQAVKDGDTAYSGTATGCSGNSWD